MKLKTHRKNLMLIISVLGFFSFSCKKDFLEAKPSTDIVIPSTLKDFQQLLDNPAVGKSPALPILSCDDYYIASDDDWAAMTPTERNAYIWDKDVFGGEVERNDWNQPFTSIFYANSILEGLKSIEPNQSNRAEYNYIKGQALFVRAFTFFDLAKCFAPPFDSNTAGSDLGLPLKLSPNVDEIELRSTVLETYNQIIDDLSKAANLLPQTVSSSPNRACKPAAYALFSRLYLSMRQYVKAELYADSCLTLYHKLVDYNTISKTATIPFTNNNDEIMYWSIQTTGYNNALYNSSSNISIDSDLLDSYVTDDLRKYIYFVADAKTGLVKVKRGYSATLSLFSGLATDEVYLIKAECMARRNDPDAMGYLNALLINRFTTDKFVPYTAAAGQEALKNILTERRKELVWRAGSRWDDLRRLNKDGANITLSRSLNNRTYTLPPNDPRYTFPIPDDEIALSNIQQNIR